MTEEPNNHNVILARYMSGPTRLVDAIAGLTEAQLDVAPAAEAWTIRQIVHHIVDGDQIWTIGIKAALGSIQAPFGFSWYWDKPQVEWAKSWNYAGRAIEPSLALLNANRHHVEQMLLQIPGAWERCLWLQWRDKQEQISVGQIVEMQAGHALGHVDDILAIRQMHGF